MMQAAEINIGQLAPLQIPVFKMLELNAEHCRLNLIQTRIAPDGLTLNRGEMAALPQRFHALDQRKIVRHNRPAIAIRAEVFRRIETESRGVTVCARANAVQSRAV